VLKCNSVSDLTNEKNVKKVEGEEGNKLMIKFDLREKQTRSDKKIRVNASLDQDTHEKLKKLATSCEMTKTMLAAELLKMCVNHLDIIDFYQKTYNKNDQYRVIPVKIDGKVKY
jgi:hypothetical protein